MSVLILMVKWAFEFPVVSIINKENFEVLNVLFFSFCHI